MYTYGRKAKMNQHLHWQVGISTFLSKASKKIKPKLTWEMLKFDLDLV